MSENPKSVQSAPTSAYAKKDPWKKVKNFVEQRTSEFTLDMKTGHMRQALKITNVSVPENQTTVGTIETASPFQTFKGTVLTAMNKKLHRKKSTQSTMMTQGGYPMPSPLIIN